MADDGGKNAILPSLQDSAASTNCDSRESTELLTYVNEQRPPWKMRGIAIIAFLLVVFAGCYGAPSVPLLLSKKTDGSYEVPDGSPSILALKRLQDSFPELYRMSKTTVLVVITALPGTETVLSEEVDKFSENITHSALKDPRTKHLGPIGAGYFLPSWFLDMHKKDPILKAGFVSPDEKTTVISFMARKEPPKELHLTAVKVRQNVVAFLEEHAANPPAGCRVSLTGDPIIAWDLDHDRSIEALLHGEICVLPIAMMVLVWLIKDLKLMLIPPITLVLAFMISSAIVMYLTTGDNCLPSFSTDIPAAMVSVSIALTLDFNLFFLTRFSNNQKLDMSLQENVENMVEYTGHTVCISGALICVAFCGSVLIPEQNVSTAGICLGATTAVCVAVCTTIPPTLLFYFPGIFARPCCERSSSTTACLPAAGDVERTGYAPSQRVVARTEEDEVSITSNISHSERSRLLDGPAEVVEEALFDITMKDLKELSDSVVGGKGTPISQENSVVTNGVWFRLMRLVERGPCVAIAVVLLVFSPLLIATTRFHPTADIYAIMPASLPSVLAMRELQQAEFPMGRFEPYLLVISRRDINDDPSTYRDSLKLPGNKTSAVLTPYAFNAVKELSTSVGEVHGLAGTVGATQLADRPVDWHLAKALLGSNLGAIKKLVNGSGNPFQLRRLYDVVMATHVKEQYLALQLHTWFPPRGAGSADWVLAVREKIADWEQKHPDMVATLSGGSVAEADLREIVRPATPRYVAFTTGVVMLLVLFMFRSIMLPLRLAFALVFTVLATFGATVFVYQTPLFHRLAPHLQFYDGLAYNTVPQTICIAIALGIDYDIFLISRIFEYRSLGFSDRESIVFGVAKTGSIISGAGIIMALAFSGLMMSPKVMLQQFGFILIVSVLLDAFVVRTILVPALMLSAGQWNWWPRQMPALRCEGALLETSQYDTQPRQIVVTQLSV
eukprot:TRINITY_DN92803_c0_g1_i1.p1 TRINITY_DN92803_c0_g1~~TRINITY_DN92803_c0_g1_i1.p1  ORF type:complete len:956 (-),score=111.98 TRINITY_DN92803_c0_g1_i1:709-3576(-)